MPELCGGVISASLKRKLDDLVKQFGQLQTTIERRLNLRNMELLFRLQRRIWWLTLVAALATIVGLLGMDERSWRRLTVILTWLQQHFF